MTLDRDDIRHFEERMADKDVALLNAWEREDNLQAEIQRLRVRLATAEKLADAERQYGELRYEEATAHVMPQETMNAARKRVDELRAWLEGRQ